MVSISRLYTEYERIKRELFQHWLKRYGYKLALEETEDNEITILSMYICLHIAMILKNWWFTLHDGSLWIFDLQDTMLLLGLSQMHGVTKYKFQVTKWGSAACTLLKSNQIENSLTSFSDFINSCQHLIFDFRCLVCDLLTLLYKFLSCLGNGCNQNMGLFGPSFLFVRWLGVD